MLLTEHLPGHRVHPSTKEELAKILEQRAKRKQGDNWHQRRL
jgi:hypothetical protein